jgi:hypothetical protein
MDTLYRKVKTNLHHYKIQFLVFQGINDDVYFIIRHSRTEVGQENQFFLRKLLFPENDQNLVLINRIHANEQVITWVQCKREYVNDKVLQPISTANKVCDMYDRHVKHAALCKHTCGPHKGYCNLAI